MKKIFFLFFPFFVQAQDVAIGQWKDYLSYNSASYIAEAENKIYCVANGGLFFVNKKDKTINRVSKITGLSDVGVKQVSYSRSLKTVIITYENCNVDLLKNNRITNISDIKRKEISGLKSINNITLRQGIAYLSCSFGLVLVDLEKEEIKDTYVIGNETGVYEVNGCAFLGDSIIAATSSGIFYAKESSQNLSNLNNWLALNEYTNEETYDNVIVANNLIVGDYSLETVSISYNNSVLTRAEFDKITFSKDDGVYTELTHSKFKNIKHAYIDNEDNLWVADSTNGLLKFENYEYKESFIPEGPVRNDIYSLEFVEKKLYQSHGGHANFGLNKLINTGVSIKDKYDDWENWDYWYQVARDILAVAVKQGKEYYASWYDGIIKMQNGQLIEQYGYANTGGVLDTVYYSNNRIRISDLKFDAAGNLWGLSSEVNRPLIVKMKNGEWHSFTMNQSQVDLFFDDLLIDRYNQKWGVLARGAGLFVYNDNNTIDFPEDDQYKLLNTKRGSGNLPSLQTYSIVEDLDGEIWVGTDKGIGVFYNSSAIFSGSNFDSEQILIQEGSYGQYLLSEEKIKCIAVDGANRKWIGTENSGVFLVSEDGLEQLLHFNTKNSPLFSNKIVDIAINPNNGEVFIGTEKGLISYRSDATKGEEQQKETSVFPNPVRESYNGPIAINGLTTNANIKITDVDGNLVFEDFAKGGQAIWNGKNKMGNRASSGIYLVFSTNSNGVEKIVSKILFIK